MKNLTILTLIAFMVLPLLVKADPGDVTLTLIIRAVNVADAKAGILREHAVPLDEDTQEPLYTEKAWIEKLAKDYLRREYRAGKQKLIKDQAANNIDIFE